MSSGSMLPTNSLVRFLHLVPNWQKSVTMLCVWFACSSCTRGGKNQALLVEGFSKIQGMPCLSNHLMILIAALKHALPTSNLWTSCKGRFGKPQGQSRVRITLVRSRACEKEEQGGANIAARTKPLWMSVLILLWTAGFVKSWFSPWSISHSRVLKPRARAARATPPAPAKKSAMKPFLLLRLEVGCLDSRGLA